MYELGGAQQLAYTGQQQLARMPTMAERLKLAVEQAEDKLAKAKRAKEIFEAHPELEELMNILQSGNF
jgi:ABC-type branched-subunit amino acid transport system ATPase component